jgi:hypothetical protein
MFLSIPHRAYILKNDTAAYSLLNGKLVKERRLSKKGTIISGVVQNLKKDQKDPDVLYLHVDQNLKNSKGQPIKEEIPLYYSLSDVQYYIPSAQSSLPPAHFADPLHTKYVLAKDYIATNPLTGGKVPFHAGMVLTKRIPKNALMLDGEQALHLHDDFNMGYVFPTSLMKRFGI